jgi:general secretion pathway protein D
VFLRPVVMRDQAASNKVSLDRYDYIRAEQLNAQPVPSGILQINESPLLPPIRPDSTGPTGVPRPLGDMTPPPPTLVPSVPVPASGASAPPPSN